jgi:hypothetical protein
MTLLCVKAKDWTIDERERMDKVVELVEQANQEHRKKIERYKAERGWMN